MYSTHYNLIKDGNIVPDGFSTSSVTASGVYGLYSGDVSQVAYTVSGSTYYSFNVVFGEYYKVGCLKYYCNPVVLGDLYFYYGKDSPEYACSLTSSGSYVFSDINDLAGVIKVVHSGSLDTQVNQFIVECVLNDDITFSGSSWYDNEDVVPYSNAPIGYSSSVPLPVRVYNEDSYTKDLFVSADTTENGDFILISSGIGSTYYGINEYGIKQPSSVPMVSFSDSMEYENIDDLFYEWDCCFGAKSYFYVNEGCVTCRVESTNMNVDRFSHALREGLTVSLINKQRFSLDQSFTIKADIKVTDIDLNIYGFDYGQKIFLGFSDSWPINGSFGYVSDLIKNNSLQSGRSMSAVWIGGRDVAQGSDIYVGASIIDNTYDSYYTSFDYDAGSPMKNCVKLEELSENVFMEANYLDGTDSAPWRTLKIVYNHLEKKSKYYINNVMIDEQSFNVSPVENVSIFLSFCGLGDISFDIRNISVVVDENDYFFGDQYLCTSSSYLGDDYGPDKAIDGIYGKNQDVRWISSLNPSVGDKFYITFSGSTNISNVRIFKPDVTDLISVSGTYYRTRYSFKELRCDFDSGDVRYVYFLDNAIDGLNDWQYASLVTSSGTIEDVSNVNSASVTIVDLFDRESGFSVFAVDEIQFYTVSGTRIDNSCVYGDDYFGWFNGKWHNMVRTSSNNVFSLESTDLYDASLSEVCEDLVRYIDYDVSSPVFSYDYMSVYRHYAESVFKILRNWAGYDHTMLSIYPGPEGWVWRFFEEKVNLKGIFVEFLSSSIESTDYFNGRPDKWKVQYLVLGGDPNNEQDWVDIPPVSIVYSIPSDYADFTSYLVSNNDGEYYTNFLDSFSSLTSISVPSSLLGYKNKYNKVTTMFNDSVVFSFYVEFDSSYLTQAARFIVADGYYSESRATVADGYTIRRLGLFSDVATGSYTSPIFDTETNQNTERIFTEIVGSDGNVSVLYRSSSTPPDYKADAKYEVWEDMGEPFAGLGTISSLNYFSMSAISNKIYFLCYNNDYMFYYDVSSRRWFNVSSNIYSSENGTYYPDSRMLNNMVSFGSNLYMAARSADSSGGVYSSVIMRYNTVADDFNYSGWYIYPQQRPEGAITASMVSDNSRYIYSISEEGVVISFDTVNGVYTVGARQSLPLYGGVSRTNFVPGYYNGKLYVAGGTITYNDGSYSPCDNLDIFDISSGVWSVGSSLPYRMEKTKCLVYNNDIYVIRIGTYSYYAYVPYLKYSILDNSWVVVESLGYNRANNWLGYSSGYGVVGDFIRPDAACIVGDYVYSYSDLKKVFRRFKLKKDVWSSGFLADKENVYWYNSGGIPWVEVFNNSEFLPQERYIQYKVQVTGNSNVGLSGATIVKPIPLRDVPSGGSKTIYVKTNLDSSFAVDSFYSGRIRVYD